VGAAAACRTRRRCRVLLASRRRGRLLHLLGDDDLRRVVADSGGWQIQEERPQPAVVAGRFGWRRWRAGWLAGRPHLDALAVGQRGLAGSAVRGVDGVPHARELRAGKARQPGSGGQVAEGRLAAGPGAAIASGGGGLHHRDGRRMPRGASEDPAASRRHRDPGICPPP
jgi:hypothetical protein